jgi:hypothetical protein
MSEPVSLLIVDYSKRTALATAEAEQIKESALQSAALIGKVTNKDEQDLAVAAQTQIKRVMKLITDAEDAAKEPLNELRGNIIDLAKKMRSELDAEGYRVAGLVGTFQEKERQRVISEQRAAQAELDALERAKHAELAKAPTIEAQDAVREKFSNLAADTTKSIQPERAKGQSVRTDWEVTITDIAAIYRANPNCVNLTAKLTEIKACLNAGMTLPGIVAHKVTLAGVRLTPERKAITV